MARCLLCDAEGANDRLCACDICSTCRDGGLHDAFARWGFTVEERAWTKPGTRNSPPMHHVEVTLRQPAQLDARAHFGRENTFDRVLQWFWPTEPQVGDPLFDRFVFVGEASGVDLERLLADSAVQAAVFELVAFGDVRLEPGRLKAHGSSAEPLFPHQVAAALALLAVQIELQAQLGG